MITRPKLIVVEYSHDLMDPNVLIAYIADGGRLVLTRCDDSIFPPKRTCKLPLYATEHRHFFTLKRGKLGEIFETLSPSQSTPGRQCHNGKRGNQYCSLRQYGNIHCHKVILLTYSGPRPVYNDGKAAEADHKNGDPQNFCLDNLQWVHPNINRWRSVHVLQVLRAKGIDPTTYTGSQMDKWFLVLRMLETRVPRPKDIFTKADLLRFYAMPVKDLKTLLRKFQLITPLNPGEEPRKYA